jgi:hypothetical protein
MVATRDSTMVLGDIQPSTDEQEGNADEQDQGSVL